jgi:hypothetical protein
MRSTLPSVLLVLVVSVNSVVEAATYYVSNHGADQNDGRSPETAWAMLARVNRGPIRPGDRVLFRRNDQWRGQLTPTSGDAKSGPVTYGAYGEGEKPLLLGSLARNDPKQWADEGNGVWVARDFPRDVGNIIFGNDVACGVKKWEAADLRRDGDYWYDEARHLVKLRMGENPAKRYSCIECAICEHVINEDNRSYVVYENLTVKYGAAHGIGGGSTHHIVVRDCDFGLLGGGAT